MKLSVLIPTRKEPYLLQTIADIRRNAVTDPEILWEEDLGLGQRALTNKLACRAQGEYVMKVDAHCSFGSAFDRILLDEMEDNTILAPQMGVLEPKQWTVNGKKMTANYYFDGRFVLQYETQHPGGETMCLPGACWMISKENYHKWNICDESLGSWGGQSVELGITSWLNGGKCKTTKKTFYGHLFRHRDGEFPYDRGERPGQFATEELRRRYLKDPRMPSLAKKFGRVWYNDL